MLYLDSLSRIFCWFRLLYSALRFYEVSRVLGELWQLREAALRLPLGMPLRLGGAIIGGGALNHGPPLVAVATAHSPRLGGAVGAGVRGLYAVLRLLPVRGLAVLVLDRESDGSEDRRDDCAPVPCLATACAPDVYMAKSLDGSAGEGPALPFGPNTASAASRLYSAFSAFLRSFSSFSIRLRSFLFSIAISLDERCVTSLEISIPSNGVDD